MALLAVGVMHEIARGNGGVPAHGSYQLLDEEFFTDTFAETVSAADGIAADRLPICI